MADRYDLVVIGAGPAGEKGAAQAAFFGKRVALVEKTGVVGGTGINTGTIPSKTLRETALYFSGLKARGLYGIDYSLKRDLDVRTFLYRERHVVETARTRARKNLEKHRVELVWGEATLLDPHTVRVAGKDGKAVDLAAAKVLISTGSSPFHPPGLPFGMDHVYDSDGILSMDRIPRTLAVLGGGVIGCEYASIFQALDVKVTLVEGKDRLLGFVDLEIGKLLEQRLQVLGMTILFGERVHNCTVDRRVTLHMESGRSLTADKALFATGRQANIGGLGLDKVGVALGERGAIKVNEHYQTTHPDIYAAGDVIGFPALASVSMEQARVAACHAFDQAYKDRVSPIQPLAVYTIPEISMVGKTEEELKAAKTDYRVGRSFHRDLARGQILGDEAGCLKLLAGAPDGKLLGVHILGELSSELIHLGAEVIQEGGSVRRFVDSVFNYPTLHEGYKHAAYEALAALSQPPLPTASG